MNKTKIEWTDYTLNPIKGKCKMGCSYCYARKIYDRFKWNPEVRFAREELDKILTIKKPSKIFLCSTHEIFGQWVPDYWIREIFMRVELFPQHIFQALTKCPENAAKFIIPDNVWLGVTVTGKESKNQQWNLLKSLAEINADIRFFSFEPLLAEPIDYRWEEITEWAIIGAQTNPYKPPKKEWVETLIRYYDMCQLPVFLKDNLKPLMGNNLRQEFPDE